MAIEDGLVALKEAHNLMERAFFSLNSTTMLSKDDGFRAIELLDEVLEMASQMRKVVS